MLDLGLLFLRVSVGATMLFAHGIPKLLKFSELSQGFPDPLGIGHTGSLVLVLFAEVVCAFFITLGLFTRFVALPLLITMLVAAFIIHSQDPFSKQEFALLYAYPCLALIFTGAGRFSLERLIKKS